MAIGENPSNFGGKNYISALQNQVTGGQIGDTTLLNDDIFGLLALVATGPLFDKNTKAIERDFLLAHQNSDGGFSWAVGGASDSNDTAAAIQALEAVRDNKLSSAKVGLALIKARRYLLNTQNNDGGFGYDAASDSDGSSTAWAVMALNSMGLTNNSKTKNAKNYLVANQMPDGGYPWQTAFGSDTYTSSHALAALNGKSWLLKVFN